jgi:excisionase family DNA binding protein
MRESFDDLPLLLTVQEVQRLLRVGRTAAYEAIRCGDIPSIKVGRSIRVPKSAVAGLLGLNVNGGGGGVDTATP